MAFECQEEARVEAEEDQVRVLTPQIGATMQKQYVVTLLTAATPQQAVPSWPAGVEAIVRVSSGTNATRYGLSSGDAAASPQMNLNVLHDLGQMDVSKLWFTHDSAQPKIQVLVDLI